MPVQYRIRSVAVVLPASMCAMMPKLRTLLRSVSTSFCATEVFPLFRLLVSSLSVGARPHRRRYLPAIMREGAVCLGHLVGVLASFDGGPEAVAGIHDLVCQALDHGLLPTLPGEADEPAQRQGVGPPGPHLDGHLIRGTTDSAAAHLQGWLDIVQGPLQRDHRIGAGLFAGLFERCIYNALGQGFLPLHQNLV